MRITRHILFWILSVILLGCSPTKEELDFIKPNKDVPLREAFNVRFIFSEEAVIKATLEAPHAVERKRIFYNEAGEEREESYQEFDQGVEMTFFDEAGLEKSRLTALYGEFPGGFNRAEFRGNVVVKNVTGETMVTDKLFWNKKEELIWAPYILRPPQPIYYVDKRKMEGNRPDAIRNTLETQFAGKPDSLIWKAVHNDLDSLIAIPEKTAGDSVLLGFLHDLMDTTWTRPVINQVEVSTDTEHIYGDSLEAAMDFSKYKIYNIRGAVEMEDGL